MPRPRPISRTVSPSQLQEDDSYRENEKKTKNYNENKKSRVSQESKTESYLNSTNSSDSSPPHDSKSSRKSEKNEPKQQVYHELTQQTLRLEKPKVSLKLCSLSIMEILKKTKNILTHYVGNISDVNSFV